MESKKTFDKKDIVKKAFNELTTNVVFRDYKKDDEEIMRVLNQVAETEETLTTKMRQMINEEKIPDVEKQMATIIGDERVRYIKESFRFETYRMQLNDSVVTVKREDKEFSPARKLESIKDIEHVLDLQWTSLVVEILIFELNCAGILIKINQPEMEILQREVKVYIQNLEFHAALIKLVEAWNKQGVTIWEKAKAIFRFLDAIFSLGMLWKIINLIVQPMTLPNKILSIAEIALTIFVALATDGIALIARIAMAIVDAYHLEQKIVNIGLFSKKEKELK